MSTGILGSEISPPLFIRIQWATLKLHLHVNDMSGWRHTSYEEGTSLPLICTCTPHNNKNTMTTTTTADSPHRGEVLDAG